VVQKVVHEKVEYIYICKIDMYKYFMRERSKDPKQSFQERVFCDQKMCRKKKRVFHEKVNICKICIGRDSKNNHFKEHSPRMACFVLLYPPPSPCNTSIKQ